MLLFMVVVFVTVLVLAAWANNPTDAGAGQASTASVNPISLVTPTALNGTPENPEF